MLVYADELITDSQSEDFHQRKPKLLIFKVIADTLYCLCHLITIINRFTILVAVVQVNFKVISRFGIAARFCFSQPAELWMYQGRILVPVRRYSALIE